MMDFDSGLEERGMGEVPVYSCMLTVRGSDLGILSEGGGLR